MISHGDYFILFFLTTVRSWEVQFLTDKLSFSLALWKPQNSQTLTDPSQFSRTFKALKSLSHFSQTYKDLQRPCEPCVTFIAESAYLVLNFLSDWKPVEKLKRGVTWSVLHFFPSKHSTPHSISSRWQHSTPDSRLLLCCFVCLLLCFVLNSSCSNVSFCKWAQEQISAIVAAVRYTMPLHYNQILPIYWQ